MLKLFQKPPKQNNALSAVRKKVIVQAIIAVQTIIITIALIFGMSAAWYTNVLQTSGLQFEAKSWGFSGTVDISDEAIQASPGESGIVGLSVYNTGSSMTDVTVHVSKVQMAEEMQKRLFFYVDTAHTRNDEILQRVYVNTRDGYSYTMKGDSQLVLTAERFNDSPLKWQWVYDMLGYYFLGTVTVTEKEVTVETVDEETGEITSTQEMKPVYTANADDYLRPVEYDLDSATFDENGMLETVDGTTSVDQFLMQLSAADGYEGDITAATIENISDPAEDTEVEIDVSTQVPGFYQVDVDENGYGIWVYLCSWAEIQQATVYDSALGQAAADAEVKNNERVRHIARLTVMGQAIEREYSQVTTVEQLTAALNNGGNVQLQQDLTLTEPITINSSVEATLDLNGHTITGASGDSMMKLTNMADVTVLNGELVANDKSKDVISVVGSSLTLDHVNISGLGDDAIDIADQKADIDSMVRLLDSEIKVDGCAVFVRGNGTVSEGRTRIIIENCKLDSGYVTIMGNGSGANWGTDVQVYQSELIGKYAAVYQPQGDSVIRLVESSATAQTGIVMKGGDLQIVNSTVSGAGEKSAPKLDKSGFISTGDAVYIDCTYQTPVNVTIWGEKTSLTSANSLAVQVFVPESTEKDSYVDYSSVIITGGTFNTDVSAYVPDGYAYADGKVTGE